MFSLNYQTKDPLRLYAISHMIERSGIPFSINSNKKTNLAINYGVKGDGDFSINIPEYEISNDFTGVIRHNNYNQKLFQVPDETSGPKSSIIAEYISDNKKYPCISRISNTVNYGFDLFRETGFILSGSYERSKRKNTVNFVQEIFRTPVTDFHEELLIENITAGCEYLNIPLIKKSYWPEGKNFAVCLTHDVDEFRKTYQWITRPARAIRKKDYIAFKNQILSLFEKIQGKEPYWTFENIMDIEREYDVKSTYYFLKESGNKSLFKPEKWHMYGRCRSFHKPEIKILFKILHDSGNEIGVHGSTYSYNNADLLKEQIREIEEISGAEIQGIRQHRLNLNIPATWQHQADAGLLYDTSLGYKAAYGNGFRFGTCFPFSPAGDNLTTMDILEIPLSIMDISLPPGEEGWDEAQKIVATIEDYRGVLTLLWHPPVFNSLEHPLLGEYYRRMIKICKEKDAWITTGQNIALWWKKRRNSSILLKNDNGIIKIINEEKYGQFIDIITPVKKETELIEGDKELSISNEKFSESHFKENEISTIIVPEAL